MALESFRQTYNREPGELHPELKEMVKEGYRPTLEDTARIYRSDEAWIAYKMCEIISATADPRTPEYLQTYFEKSNKRRKDFLAEREADLEGEPGDSWSWRGPKGAWHETRLRPISWDDPERVKKEKERQREEIRTWKEIAEHWGINGEGPHNEGILRDHPRYEELFKKWGRRALRRSISSEEEYQTIMSLEGYKFRDALAKYRNFIDASISEELLATEGFIDITNDPERQETLNIHPVSQY